MAVLIFWWVARGKRQNEPTVGVQTQQPNPTPAAPEQTELQEVLKEWKQGLREWRERAEQAESRIAITMDVISELTTRLRAPVTEDATVGESGSPSTPTAYTSLNRQIGDLADELVRQIMVALSEAEEAFTSAINAFSAIADEAQQTADIARGMVGGEQADVIATITAEAIGLADAMMQQMQSATGEETAASTQLEGMVQAITELNGLLDEMDREADQALAPAPEPANVAVVAVEEAGAVTKRRVPRRGQAELTGLAKRCLLTTAALRRTLHALAGQAEGLGRQLGQGAGQNAGQSSQTYADFQALLGRLTAADQQTQETAITLSGQSDNIRERVVRIMVAFQVHDLLRQRLEHVADPLSALRDELWARDEMGATQAKTGTDGLSLALRPSNNAISVGAAPSLTLVSYGEDAEDDVTLF
jgi:hypothetical protein